MLEDPRSRQRGPGELRRGCVQLTGAAVSAARKLHRKQKQALEGAWSLRETPWHLLPRPSEMESGEECYGCHGTGLERLAKLR